MAGKGPQGFGKILLHVCLLGKVDQQSLAFPAMLVLCYYAPNWQEIGDELARR